MDEHLNQLKWSVSQLSAALAQAWDQSIERKDLFCSMVSAASVHGHLDSLFEEEHCGE